MRGVGRRFRSGVGCGESCGAYRGMARKSESGVAGVASRWVGGEVCFTVAQVCGCFGSQVESVTG